MVKKSILYIFIYTLLIGCNIQNPVYAGECSGYELEISAPRLQKDWKGYYHMEWLDGYVQTFSTLKAETGSYDNYQKVGWISNKEINISGEWTNLVNSSSYTNGGVARQTMAVWEEMIGDTITIYAGFTDWCDIQYLDSLGVIVEDEI